MKRDIFDLLDTYSDESVDLDGGTPLSPSYIKELTMSKITQKTSHRLRTPVRVLIAAAVVAALSVSALAADYIFGAGELLQGFFTKGRDNLTPGQIEVMDEMGKTFEGGVTSNGTTITPIAALADEHVYYLRLRIEAPEDVILPDLDEDVDGYYQLFGDGVESVTELDTSAYEAGGCEIQLSCLPDSDPTDNVKELVLRITAQQGSDIKFNDGVSKPLTLGGLSIQSPDKVYTKLFSGEFTFDIGLYYESKMVSVDCGGATYYDQVYGFTNILDELELSPLSLSYSFRSTLEQNNWVVPGLGDIRIVLKDGTVFWPEDYDAETYQGDPGPGFDPTSVKDEYVYSEAGYYVFDAPLDLTQVDYVQYGEYKIPVVIE